MRAFVVGGALLGLAVATPAAAQTSVGFEGALFSSYVWRGLSLTNRPVFEPDLWITFPLGSASLTVGGWGNIEIGEYDGSDHISQSGGRGAFNLSEFDPYAEIGVPVGKATLTGGAVGYIYPNDFGLTEDDNTVEVYGKVELDVPLAPSLAVYYDVDNIKGAYVEGSVSHSVPVGTSSLDLGLLAGWTGGQEVDSDPSANFRDSGITHIDVSASMSFSVGRFTLTPTVHGIFGQDQWTKFTSPTDKSDFKVWGGVSIGWEKVFGGAEEE